MSCEDCPNRIRRAKRTSRGRDPSGRPRAFKWDRSVINKGYVSFKHDWSCCHSRSYVENAAKKFKFRSIMMHHETGLTV